MVVRIRGLGRFKEDLNRFARESIPADVVSLQKQIFSTLLELLVTRTPVDTGLARNNWITSINQPRSDRLVGRDPSGQGAISRGKSRIESIKMGDSIFIVNNLPYVELLERGRSNQQPLGWIARSLNDVRVLIQAGTIGRSILTI